jgi:hypothetical protein
MRWNVLVAIGLLVASAIAVVVVACSSDDCKPNTFTIQARLVNAAVNADTITVQGTDPGMTFSQTFPHTPGDAGLVVLDVSFPGGYPSDKLVHLLLTATGGVTTLGVDTIAVHTDPTCTVAQASIIASPIGLDMSNVD